MELMKRKFRRSSVSWLTSFKNDLTETCRLCCCCCSASVSARAALRSCSSRDERETAWAATALAPSPKSLTADLLPSTAMDPRDLASVTGPRPASPSTWNGSTFAAALFLVVSAPRLDCFFPPVASLPLLSGPFGLNRLARSLARSAVYREGPLGLRDIAGGVEEVDDRRDTVHDNPAGPALARRGTPRTADPRLAAPAPDSSMVDGERTASRVKVGGLQVDQDPVA
mmetsp:Transcript_10042/g.30589  ORF Transcript_10042/g.30589 Transcript_10042/m.30589 type:complete len:227 (-) Transcript_10042:97-777(-)